MNRKNLNKPPIKEVIIGISFKSLFSSFDEIDQFCNKISSGNKFINREETKVISFEINEEPKVSKSVSSGIVLSSKENLETVNIEPNKIMFIDKSNYSDFETFFKKFKKIIKEIKSDFQKDIEIVDIGLRYVNSFDLSTDDLDKYFKIYPTIICQENDSKFAGISNYLAMANLVSSKEPNLQATIKTLFNIKNDSKLNIVFDIDTHILTSYKLNKIEDFQKQVLKLKQFKNQIFFSNFVDAHSMEEFK